MFNKKNKIKFFSIDEKIPNSLCPKPASLSLPDWYKNQEPYNTKDKKNINGQIPKATIKRCIPIFDSITSGYIIFSTVDIYITQKNGNPFFHWPINIADDRPPIDFHENDQFFQHPKFKNLPNLPKFFNPWVIKTPNGYSCFITNPMHRELPFEILPGIVDTDNYNVPVEFPFYLKDQKWEGMIPSGTPIAQVIPFKREDWKMDNTITKEDIEKSEKDMFLLKMRFFSRYKKNFWKKKNFT